MGVLTLLSMILLAIWMLSGCQKNPPRSLLPEDRLEDPKADGCVCPGVDLTAYKLIGCRKYGRIVAWLDRCEFDGFIHREIHSVPATSATALGCTCKTLSVGNFKVIGDIELERAQRDIEDCRAKMLIQNINPGE